MVACGRAYPLRLAVGSDDLDTTEEALDVADPTETDLSTGLRESLGRPEGSNAGEDRARAACGDEVDCGEVVFIPSTEFMTSCSEQ